jgi:hypothetical protein
MKLLLVLLVLGLGPVQAQRFSLETGYQVRPVAGPYLLLRYNYPLAQVNLGSGMYVWLLPELGVLPDRFYGRLQVLLENPSLTLGADFRLAQESIFRIFVRTEF